MMETNQDVLAERRDGGLFRITINRPHKHNALARSVLDRIAGLITDAGSDSDVRIILLHGAGEKYFAAGGDLRDLSSVRTPEATRAMSEEAGAALDAIRQCQVPVIAYLNGDAIGGGAELALACDMRLFAASARIGYVQGKLAITPAWGGGTDLFRAIGSSRALRLMARCDMVGADLAVEWGLAEAVIQDGADGEDIKGFLGPMLDRAPQVLRAIKKHAAAWRSSSSYDDLRRIEQENLIATWMHDDHWAVAERILSKETK